MSTFVGIDLGTTNSVVAYRNAYGRPLLLADQTYSGNILMVTVSVGTHE